MLIAEGRAGRPNDYAAKKSSAAPAVVDPAAPSPGISPSCPFCRGNESHTPHTLVERFDEEGRWQVRVVPNRYPAVISGEGLSDLASEARSQQVARGGHEVIIEAPLHVGDFRDLAPEALVAVLSVYRDRVAHWSGRSGIASATIFKNFGPEAGASLEHIHSQLVALPFIPDVLQRELDASRAFLQCQGKCLKCHVLAEETRSGERMVAEVGGLVAWCAVAGRQPYETLIVPRGHTARFEDASHEDLVGLAQIFQEVLVRLAARLPGVSYNLVLHTAPADQSHSEAFHWHWELVPRSTALAGIELGIGVHINSLSPERAAQLLRTASR